MNRMPHLTAVVCFIVAALSLIACKGDDEGNNQEEELIGVWQRSDANAAFEIQIGFDADYTGFISSRTTDTINNTSTSSALPLEWITFGNDISIVIAEEEIITSPYSINVQGQLILTNYTEFPFDKLD